MKTKMVLFFLLFLSVRSLMAADVVLNNFEAGSPTVTPLYGAAFSIVANPNTTGNPSAFCGQISRTSTNWWEMISFSTSFTVLPNTSQYVHILINYPVQPSLTISLNISGQIAQSNAYTKIGQWQDIVFEIQGGTDGVTVNSLGIFDDLSSALVTGTYGYMDNVILNNDPFPQGASFLTGNNLYDFEPGTANNITGVFTYSSTNDIITYPVANPFISGVNKTANCLKRTAIDPSQWWSGFEFMFVNPVLVDATHNYLHLLVTAPYDGQTILYNVKQGGSYVINGQPYAVTTGNTWEDVVIDVSALTYISGFRIECGDPVGGTLAGDYYFDQLWIDGDPNPRTNVTAVVNVSANADCKIYSNGNDIYIQNSGAEKIATIFNVNGKKVFSKQIIANEKISMLNSGLYLVKIGTQSQKVLIK
jgi:hypothetical protein